MLRGWLTVAVVVATAAVTEGQRANDPPKFLPGGDMRGFTLREDTPVGSSVYQLKGRDPEGTPVSFTVSGDHLSVSRDTGVVTLVRALDRESLAKIEAIITVTDERVYGFEANTVPLRREIPVLDVNDNPPVYHDQPYTFTVSESASPGATLFSQIKVSDADEGENAKVTLECVREKSPEACEQFEVRAAQVLEGEFVGIVSLRQILDYERESRYTLVIRASDGGFEKRLSSTATVVVEVQDVQDQPPVFLNAPFSATVREASPPGTSVLMVGARDGDLGEPRPVTLTLEGDDAGYFTLQDIKTHEDGSITATLATTNVTLNRENPLILNNGGLYTFSIRAQEEGKGQTQTAVSQVTVVVTDVDDQKPVFTEDAIAVQVPEDIANGTPLPGLNLVVSDGDVGENARFTLALEDIFGSRGVFSIFPVSAVGRTPVIIKVADSSRLDFEDPSASNFVFKVVASANGEPVSAAVVNVTITDANDNAPTFPKSSYRFGVSEGVERGQLITSLLANDSDSGAFGEIRYSLKGFGAEKFRVDEEEGDIHVANCGGQTCLDYERQTTFSLTYSATDGGGKVTSVNIFIDVEDENDNSPVFSQREYRRTVDEGVKAFDPPLFVKATDADGETQGGGKVFYSLEEGNTQDEAFFVEPVSGELTIQRPLTHLDTPTSTYTLTIRATDAGEPPRYTDVRVFITVGRDTNRPPRFRQRTYKAELAEDVEAGTMVAQVSATDPDGPDEGITFLLTAGAQDNFIINTTSGEIQVAKGASLDRDVTPQFEVVVAAVDSGAQTRQTSTTTLTVTLQDVNNKPPKFSQESYVQYVSERLPAGEEVLRVRANDPDQDASLHYSIDKPVLARDKTGVALNPASPYDYLGAFRINETSGAVEVAGPLNHNEAAVVILPIVVTDKNASASFPNQTDMAEVTLYIQAFSDKNPIFVPPWTPSRPQLQVQVKEEQELGTKVFSVIAKDPVSGQPVRRYEKVEGSDPDNMFSVSAITGEVSLNSRLDYEASETKTAKLQVLAIAGDRSSQASITVNIEDVNDNSPIFTENEYHTRLAEDARFPKSVLTVSATDADTKERGEVRYTLGGEGALLFVINETTGEIVVARGAQLDREASPTITLEVTAHDTPEGGITQRKTTVIVEVELVDVNDEVPVWSEEHYTAVVAENTVVGSPVTQVLATDPDLGLNGLVRYQLPEPQGEVEGLFSLDSETGVLKVKAPLNGKGRTEAYEVTVRAVDQGTPQQYSEAIIHLLIGDVSTNDGVPTFKRPAANEGATIMENSKVGTAVFQVEAEDPDDPNTPNGKINYSFLDDGSDSGIFEIDATTGMIRTRAAVDREAREQYTVVVVAQDLGRPPQLSSRLLTINITDVDDNPPVFVRFPGGKAVEVEVEEEAAIGTVAGYVAATDNDSGDNALIDYRITDGNDRGLFAINRTFDNRGMIFVSKRIDREEVDSVTLTLLCGKLGRRMPAKMEYDHANPAMMQVRIMIRDLDDNKPAFLKKEMTTGVRVDAALQTEVLKLRAEDKDPTALPIRYGLHNISFSHLEDTVELLPEGEVNATGVFLLEESTGVLRTNAPLTRYTHGFFTAFVTASSSLYNTPSDEPAVAKVMIYVLRDSDLLRFVFRLTPGEVRRRLNTFSKDVESVLPVAASLNIYETAYYSEADGAIDFSSTGSCFQLEGRNMHDTEVLLDASQNPKLNRVFEKYSVRKVERCVPRREASGADWVEVWVMVIAAFIGVGGAVAACAVCCLYSHYRRKVKRHNHHMRLLDAPPSVGPVLPPGSIVMLPPGPLGPPGHPGPVAVSSGAPMPPASILSSEPPRAYEWQERGLPLDSASYRSAQR
ncbi:cadherin-23-like [Eriocheir sinensis]|uniref:cadherin-23-like n=1 Tax=Eriocheir sinensis TaxID=95602 RepID=UPI0021C8012E|nr:cadherin-23-like [Eriocheir sinensis]